MIKGLEIFKKQFEDYKDQYVLIGGSACWVVMDQEGLKFRNTKDLDIVLIAETLSLEFSMAFHRFIKEGEYGIIQKSEGKPCFYRFTKPKNSGYPFMIEILSIASELMADLVPGSITRMTIDEEVISLSAIVMNRELYQFLKSNMTIIDGLPIADEICLIPLKIRAWIDLSEKEKQGIKVKKGDIAKHKNDVYRLSQLLTKRTLLDTPAQIKNDVAFFTEHCVDDEKTLLDLGIENTSLHEIMSRLSLIYGVK
jgi:hypothetical protein